MFKCKVCGRKMEVTEIDREEGIAWISCPEYERNNDQDHDSYSIKLTESIEDIFLNQ